MYRSVALGVVIVALATGCSSSSSGKPGDARQDRDASPGQTADAGVRGQGGLFHVCLGPQDCTAGLVCGCDAVCTVPCGAGSDSCGALDAGASCPSSQTVTATCDPSITGCVVPCGNDAGCRALGPTASCVGGLCRIPQDITLVDGGAPSCQERLAPLRAQADPAVASADRSCQQDSDCVNVSASNRCYGFGCPLTYVSKTAGAQLDALFASLDVQYCETILRAGCVLPAGAHSCPLITAPACTHGTCGYSIPISIQPDASAD